MQYDAAANLEMGKLLPKNWVSLFLFMPVLTKRLRTPEYDPYDLDIKLKEKVRGSSGKEKSEVKKAAIDKTTIKTVNFTNVRINAWKQNQDSGA